MRLTILMVLLLCVVGCNVKNDSRQKNVTDASKKAEEVSKKNGDKVNKLASLNDLTTLKNVDVSTLKEGLGVGDLAPNIQGEDAQDVTFSLEDYRGNVIMLDFWGNW